MEELKSVLKDALERIDRIETESTQHNSSRVVPSTAPSSSSYVPPSSSYVGLRAQANFRAAFPHYYGVRQSGAQLSNSRPRKKARTVQTVIPIVVKDTWTHDFLLLQSPSSGKTPSVSELTSLSLAGLGRKKIVFNNKHGDFGHLRSTLEKEFPKLESQKGAFELFRADRGGSSRPLIPIPVQRNGYSIPFLKDVISSHAAIYIRPMQSDLDMEPSQHPTQASQINIQCVNCRAEVPIQAMKEHTEVCQGGSSKTQDESEDDDVQLTSASLGVHEQVLHDAVPRNDTVASESGWIERLCGLFPDTPVEKVQNIVYQSVSLEEATDQLLCEAQEGKQEEKNHFFHGTVDSLIQQLSSKVTSKQVVITIKREDIWREALCFYKKFLTNPEKLWDSPTVYFEGEDGLDGGAMKAEFFELLLEQIKKRLFEGDEYLIPIGDSSKGLLLKLAGVIISHSLIHWGPSFAALSPAIYYHIAGADADTVLSQLRKQDIPLNAGTGVLHSLIEKLQKAETVKETLEEDPSSEAYWAIINAAHWPPTKEITDKEVPFLLQHLIENEVILSRKYAIDQFAEGLSVSGLLQLIKDNKEVCYNLFCYNINNHLTPDIFSSFFSSLNEPTDFTHKQCFHWFLSYVQNSDQSKLQSLLQFATGYKSIPPRGLPHKICVRYLPEDDEKASMPTSSACLAILSLPTIHCVEAKFIESFDCALKYESQGFPNV